MPAWVIKAASIPAFASQLVIFIFNGHRKDTNDDAHGRLDTIGTPSEKLGGAGRSAKGADRAGGHEALREVSGIHGFGDAPGNLVTDNQGGEQLPAVHLMIFRQSQKCGRNGLGDVDASEIQAVLDLQQGAQHGITEGGVACGCLEAQAQY
jgi:hypothetical protein